MKENIQIQGLARRAYGMNGQKQEQLKLYPIRKKL